MDHDSGVHCLHGSGIRRQRIAVVYPNELFPTEIRGSAAGFATAVSRVGSAISTFLLPFGYTTFGPQALMLLVAAVVMAGLVVSAM